MKRYIILQGKQLYTRGVISLTENRASFTLFGVPNRVQFLLFKASSPRSHHMFGYVDHLQTEILSNLMYEFDSCIVFFSQKIYLVGTYCKSCPDWSRVFDTMFRKETPPIEKTSFFEKFEWHRYHSDFYPDTSPIILCIFNHPHTIKKISTLSFYYLGINHSKTCVALPAKPEESNPFPHLEDCSVCIDGYWTVCADKEKLHYYSVS